MKYPKTPPVSSYSYSARGIVRREAVEGKRFKKKEKKKGKSF